MRSSPLPRRRLRALLVGLFSLLAFPAALLAGSDDAGPPLNAAQLRFFESEVRPLLAEHCLKCHGPDKQKGGLRLDSREAILQGGESGPAVVPGEPGDSLMVEAIDYGLLQMPPTGQLDEPRRETLRRWVEIGAPWPAGGPEVARTPSGDSQRRPGVITDEDRAFWSFQPLKRPEPPEVADPAGWCRNPIDLFVLARLKDAGLEPAPEADRRTLLRRLTLDLWGLPPTPEQVEAFVNDPAPDAYERCVERLLASPRYGERWGRHWLDLVRYADSDGYRQDAYRPDAWRFRDYVIQSFNDDKPYDRFVREQLAGDEIDPDDPTMRTAVGFYRLGTYEYNQRDVPGQWATILNDITDVTADVFLGLGMSCARCHDHKFDPILQEDYFRLQAFFAALRPRDDLPAATPEDVADWYVQAAAWDLQTGELRGRIAALEAPYREQAARGAISKFPPEIQDLLHQPPSGLSLLDGQLGELAFRQVTYEWDHLDVHIQARDKDLWKQLRKQLAEYDRLRPPGLPSVQTVTDIGPDAPATLIPGSRDEKPIEPGFLTLLEPEPASIPTPDPSAGTTGRRTVLADWLTRPDNPLTTRVIVNRVWQYHFGRGLVSTPSDFGRLGDAPSHPALLDWLATEFVARGWSLKTLHRLILNSATYRQTALRPMPEAARTTDPENRLLWRQNVRRLEAEPIRDVMLGVSGELEFTSGGPPVDSSKPRRSVFTRVIRNTHDPLLDAFDAPDGASSTPSRNVTTTATQSLLLINGPWTLARAQAFATRLERQAAEEDARIDLAYRLAFGRSPEESELADARSFLRGQSALAGEGDQANHEALVDFCHALLNSNELIYVD